MIVLDVQNLTKVYTGDLFKPKSTALGGISIAVQQGEIFGFLGQNGAGKTTTLKIIMGLNRSTSGAVTIFGKPADDVSVRAQVGYLPEHPYFYDYLTATEFMTLYARLFGLRRFDPAPLLARVGLEAARHQRLRRFSKGMLQRVGIAQALINDPALLILDEPMSGLDPSGRRLVRDLILDLKARGKTVFFSSHIISDVEAMCDRIAILHRGQICAAGRIDELLHGPHRRITVSGVGANARQVLAAAGHPATETAEGLTFVALSEEAVWVILDHVRKAGGAVVAIVDGRPALETFFMQTIADKAAA